MTKSPDAAPEVRKATTARKEGADGKPRGPVIGIESEFTLYVQDEKRLPEHIFRNPQQIVRQKMLPREGRSFHLPSGGAIYFDTGVIEVATPIIEVEAQCAPRAVRSLWEQIEFLRGELDAWEKERANVVRLEGFSTHYNISVPRRIGSDRHAMRRLARLLTYLLHAPVMLLAANKLSTGVGVRPREHRLEVTADFTPDPDLSAAATTLIVGVVLEVMTWPDFRLAQLKARGFPTIESFRPRRHTSRKGFLARFDCFPQNPFATDPNAQIWQVKDRGAMSLREIALEIAEPFRQSMRSVGDARTVRHIFAVLEGKARSLLDFAERPRRYEDVGRVVDWNRRRFRGVSRSRYEKVIQRIIRHQPLQVGRAAFVPERMQGWYEVIFRNTRTGRLKVFNLDDLARHCAL